MERLTDTSGWASERLLFLGVDGRWRHLDMLDLGLPDSWWPGADTYGPGALSLDGRTWAAHTNAGVVFVNLARGTVRHVELPQGRSMVRYLAWVPGKDVVSAYAWARRGRTYRTFHVGPDGVVRPVSYDGSRTRFDVDGVPVEIKRSSRLELTVTRWQDGNTRSTAWRMPVAFASKISWGVFGETQVALHAAARGTPFSTMIWVLDKNTGEPQARLRVPPASGIEGWLDEQTLLLEVDNRRLIAWQPGTERVRRLIDLPGPYPEVGEWAAATLALPLPQKH